MSKKPVLDAERLRHTLQAQHQVITRRQALLCGLPHTTLDPLCSPRRFIR